jgi:hypothetical protein
VVYGGAMTRLRRWDQQRVPPWFTEDPACDRSNRLLGAAFESYRDETDNHNENDESGERQATQ